MTAAPPPANTTPAAAPPPPRKSRWLRRLGFLLGVPLLLVAIAPHAVALDVVRERIEAEASDLLDVPVRIGRLGFSWFTGFAVRDLEIANPPDFPGDRPALQLRRAALELPFAALWRRQVDVAGSLDGLVLRVDLDAHGDSNLQALLRLLARHADGGGAEPPDPPEPPGPSGPSRRGDETLRAVRCDLRLTENVIEVRRDGDLLARLDGLQGSVEKPRGRDELRTELAAALRLPDPPPSPARCRLASTTDLRSMATTATLQLAELELPGLRPLLDHFAPGAITTLAGRVDGELRIDHRRGDTAITGMLTVEAPHVAGPALHGFDLRAARWSLRPDVRFADARLDTRRLRFDLGPLQLHGADAATADVAGFTWRADLAALAAAGGAWPAWLRDSGAHADGTLQLGAAVLRGAAAAWRTNLRGSGTITVPRAAPGGLPLVDLVAEARFTGERLDVTTRDTARLADGPLRLTVQSDLRGDTLPTTLTVRWRDGSVQQGAAGALRWLVPLYAGRADTAAVTGRCDLDVSLTGPGRLRGDETWLQWLDRWFGDGRITVRDGALTPAPALAGLQTPLGALGGTALGDGPRLAIDTLDAPFAFAAGAITTTAGSWLAKGRRIGLSGSVHLDGRLDYGFDVSALLRGHRDGDAVLQALGGSLPPARLRGTVDAPALALPDVANVLQRVAERELQQRGGDWLRRELDQLLRKAPKR